MQSGFMNVCRVYEGICKRIKLPLEQARNLHLKLLTLLSAMFQSPEPFLIAFFLLLSLVWIKQRMKIGATCKVFSIASNVRSDCSRAKKRIQSDRVKLWNV